MGKNKSWPQTAQKVNLRLIIDITMKVKTIKFLEENKGHDPYGLTPGNNFLNRT